MGSPSAPGKRVLNVNSEPRASPVKPSSWVLQFLLLGTVSSCRQPLCLCARGKSSLLWSPPFRPAASRFSLVSTTAPRLHGGSPRPRPDTCQCVLLRKEKYWKTFSCTLRHFNNRGTGLSFRVCRCPCPHHTGGRASLRGWAHGGCVRVHGTARARGERVIPKLISGTSAGLTTWVLNPDCIGGFVSLLFL